MELVFWLWGWHTIPNGNEPVLLSDGNIATPMGCASLSDADGNLLFYTNGGGINTALLPTLPAGLIWNRDHAVMYDMGFEEGGGFRAPQSALILPNPLVDSVYMLFTMEQSSFNEGGVVTGQPQGRGLSLFEVDMRLNGGLGAVTNPDQFVYIPAFDGLSATINQDGDGYWVIGQHFDQNINQFVIVQVEGSTVSNDNITLELMGFDYPLTGAIKISPDGEWIACNEFLFQFNNDTGEITNPDITIPGMTVGTFSPDSRYFYFWEGATRIARVDMQATDIPSSKEILLALPNNIAVGMMQLAPDGNIYFLRRELNQFSSIMGVIRCPQTASPDIEPTLFSWDANADGHTFLGLPNFADHIFARSPEGITFLPRQRDTICTGQALALYPQAAGVSYLWSDGSTADSLIVTAAGIYTVSITDACGYIQVDEKRITALSVPALDAATVPDTTLCNEASVTLTVQAEEGYTVVWSTGETTPTITVATSGLYSVSLTGACGEITDEGAITFLSTPELAIDGIPAEPVCEGQSAVLEAITAAENQLTWSTGSTDTILEVIEGGIYTATASNVCGTVTLEATLVFEDCTMMPCDLLVPNIFSPNKDGRNDVFGGFFSCEPATYQLRVFSRWGNLVFESNQSALRWDGQVNGKPAPADVYIYELQCRFDDTEDLLTRAGEVTLVR
ncbi:MAG: gliding motility-associated C-terminal domain-containing protein [Saprospiraceae bacterium]